MVGQSRPKCTTHPKNRSSQNPHFANRYTKGDKLTKYFRKQQQTPNESTGATSSAPACGGSMELERRCAGRGVGIARTAAARRDRGRRKETKLVKENRGLVRAEEEGGMEGPTYVIVLRPRMRGPPESPTRWSGGGACEAGVVVCACGICASQCAL